MNTKTTLQNKIFSINKPSRELVVKYLKVILAEARQVPLERLAAGTNTPTPRHFPANLSEEIASNITMLIQIDWIEQDAQLLEICQLAGGLETFPQDIASWRKLLHMIECLA